MTQPRYEAIATSRARFEKRAISEAIVAPVIQSATMIVTAAPNDSEPFGTNAVIWAKPPLVLSVLMTRKMPSAHKSGTETCPTKERPL